MKSRILIVLLTAISARGAATERVASGVMRIDSLLPVAIGRGTREWDQAAMAELQDIEFGYGQNGDHRKALMRLLEMAGARATLCTRKVRLRLFGDLAKVSARLRLYPLAMRCYYNARKAETELPIDSGLYREMPIAESVPIDPDSLISSFGDGKEAAFYAMLLEIKQPVAGKRKAYTHLNNVGHTFVTLIKYNRDGSIVSRIFGFYPQKTGILSATPFQPSARSVFKDDSRHDWDEAAATLLSFRQFEAILRVVKSYDHRRYHLNHSNCTDFGLEAAWAGGISVQDASGHWPLGHGNNPGSAGQSLLEGKAATICANPSDGLLIIDNFTRSR
jgi:hypothetical protein